MEYKMNEKKLFTQAFVENGKKGVKDNEGNILVPAMFDEIEFLWAEQNKRRPCVVDLDGKVGLVASDGKGTMLAECKYECGREIAFSDCYAFKDTNGKWGVINSQGKVCIPFAQDYIYMSKESSYIFYDKGEKSGVYVEGLGLATDAVFDEVVEACADSVLKVKNEGKEGFVTTEGKFISKEDYDALNGKNELDGIYLVSDVSF
jgi:hypothetical protein